jgi:hypothetical protein
MACSPESTIIQSGLMRQTVVEGFDLLSEMTKTDMRRLIHIMVRFTKASQQYSFPSSVGRALSNVPWVVDNLNNVENP